MTASAPGALMPSGIPSPSVSSSCPEPNGATQAAPPSSADIRYWADGLVMVDNGLDILPVQGSDTDADGAIDTFTVGDGSSDATLDRAAGFEAIDNAWLSITGNDNFFGTVIGDGSIAYTAGASRADVAGSGGTTRGFAPVGADGVVDQADVDYIPP